MFAREDYFRIVRKPGFKPQISVGLHVTTKSRRGKQSSNPGSQPDSRRVQEASPRHALSAQGTASKHHLHLHPHAANATVGKVAIQ
jgi:hypothetical protein